MFKDVPPQVQPDELEQAILSYWDAEKIFEKSLEQTKEGPRFTFYDGPPYATGKAHYGHILQSAIKDTVLRYKTMQGYHVPRRVGWDCHGLPVETLVEKELGMKTKKDIEKFGIEQFNQKCRDIVFRYIDDFTATLRRMGRWADYAHAYATLDIGYMESEWWVFKQLWQLGLVYKAFRSTPYCIRCATPLSNHEVSMAYKDKVDTAAYVLLKANQQYLLIWTTTPWTLPANVAVAFNPAISYVVVEHAGKQIIVAEKRVKELFGDTANIRGPVSAEELSQLHYEPLYSYLPAEGAYRLVPADYVTDVDGTGLVHIAPAFGEEDHELSKVESLPVLRTVDADGRFMAEVTDFAGMNVFAANEKIVKQLADRGHLFKAKSYTHSYPFCWRCDTPLIYYALDTWFINIQDLKERMLAINEQVKWTPDHLKHGRFAKGLESAPDWAVSRNRFWSVPLPIWECDSCEHRVCVGSVDELKKLSGVEKIEDLHRPYVDKITWRCLNCSPSPRVGEGGGEVRRIPEVLDVWFDSGAMPYAQWHYPFAHKKAVESSFPADFIVESIEMTRAWFYVLHVLAAALTTKDIGLGTDKPAFKNGIGSGIIFAEDGQKLSKKLKNYTEPELTMARYGADVLRLYLLTSASFGEPYRFSEKELQQLQRSAYLILWNVYSFFTRYATVHSWSPEKLSPPAREGVRGGGSLLDRWILTRLKQLERSVIEYADQYQFDTAARQFVPFINELSTWYLRRSRTRFHSAADDAFSTLHSVLVRLSKLLAPFMPFLSEEIYRNVTSEVSVHLAALPTQKDLAGLTSSEETLLADMATTRVIVAEALSLRAQAKLKVRQPLPQLVVAKKPLDDAYVELIQDEVNVKKVVFTDVLPDITDGWVASTDESRVKAALETTISDELLQEGLAREIIRHGQTLRREAGYALNDHITLVFKTDDTTLQQTLASHQQTIMTALQAGELTDQAGHEDASADLKINGKALHLGVLIK